MNKIKKIKTISEYNKELGLETLHPLVSVIDFAKAKQIANVQRLVSFYTIYLKEVKCGDVRYGCNYYDYEDGTMLFIAPGQVSGVENTGELIQPKGYGLLFHPDLIQGTNLGRTISDYSFFDYDVKEALHLSKTERKTIIDCLQKIENEMKRGVDKHTKKLIATNIELLLDYAMRYYERQFITREKVNLGILERFEKIFKAYYESEKPQQLGFPTVAYFAGELHLSPNYFGDLIKKETGTSAREFIQKQVIDVAKQKLFENNSTINEVAYSLGFSYPNHFSRLFKSHTGMSPNEYRRSN